MVAKAAKRPGVYACGAESVDAILKAARTILIEEGAAAFSLRRIAAECGTKVGNIGFHFPRKEILIQVMLDDLVNSYVTRLDANGHRSDLCPEEQLKNIITMMLGEHRTKRGTRLYTELWALANHNPLIGDRVRVVYQKMHEIVGEYVSLVNPGLSEHETKLVAIFISNSVAGTLPFLGYEKPWAEWAPELTALSAQWFVNLVKTLKPGDIANILAA